LSLPPYSSNRTSAQWSSRRYNPNAPSPLFNAFHKDENHPSFKSDRISRLSQPRSFDGDYPTRYTVPSTDDDLGVEEPRGPFQDPHRAALSSPPALPTGALQDNTMGSSTELEHGNAPPSSWVSTPSPLSPNRPMSVISDPFNNRAFELSGWLDSDPYSRSVEGAPPTASICSVAQRSVAASSKILPSDTSIRTLTPEPSEDVHGATLHVAVLTRFRTPSGDPGADAEGAVDGESVEGDGPESAAVRLSVGAERRGWGTEGTQQQSDQGLQRVISRSSRGRARLLHLDHLSPEVVHSALVSSGSTTPSLGVPLSVDFEAQGLGRSFIQALIGKIRWPSMAASNSPLPTIPQEATRGSEDTPAWLRIDPHETPRASTGAVSREACHGDASSIRSARAEVGWIETSLNMQRRSISAPEPVDGLGASGVPLSVTSQEQELSVATHAEESSELQSQSRPSSLKQAPPPS
jgi:hypothetical protein